MIFADFLNNLLESLGAVWGWVWFIVLPVVTGALFWQTWLYYIRYHFTSSISWKLVEIKVPRNILKTAKSMEQIFAAVHAPYTYGMRPLDKYWHGRVEYWYSFEMVGAGGTSHFFVRTPEQFQRLVETAVYAQYPDAEIIEAHDFLEDMPTMLPNETYDLSGFEFVLRKENPYPIRTYPMFEESIEERRVDPVAAIFEAFSKLQPSEQMWVQLLVRPAGEEISEEGGAIVNKIQGKKTERSRSPIFGLTLSEIMRAPFEAPSLEVKREEKAPMVNTFLLLTPGQREMIEAVERKVSKLTFETTFRFIYIDRRDSFNKDHVMTFMGAVRQFNTENLNAFKPDSKYSTAIFKGFFRKWRSEWRKRNIYYRYRKLKNTNKKPLLNIEELATVYHFPAAVVAAPRLKRIESKKGGPPAELPLFEGQS